MNDIHEDLIDLQIRLSYQEDTIAQLNQVVTKQDSDIIQLKQQLGLLAKRMEESAQFSGQDDAGGDSERPPHY